MEIWFALKENPLKLKSWYEERWLRMQEAGKEIAYEEIKANYNAAPNGADLLFISRACYGGVVRFRQSDEWISTPCGVHTPINPKTFAVRVDEWRDRVRRASFRIMDYRESMKSAKKGDLIYCDPPYRHSQGILYGSQSFNLQELFQVTENCKSRGVHVALGIDGTKKIRKGKLRFGHTRRSFRKRSVC